MGGQGKTVGWVLNKFICQNIRQHHLSPLLTIPKTMLNKPKKLWLVKREVFATSLEKAITAKGRIYEIQEANIEIKNKIEGFKKKK